MYTCFGRPDLVQAVSAVEAEMTSTYENILASIKSLNIKEVENKLQQIQDKITEITKSSTFPNASSLSQATGLIDPINCAEKKTLELQLSCFDLGVINGTAFNLDKSNNIEILRRLYYAEGRSLNKLAMWIPYLTEGTCIPVKYLAAYLYEANKTKPSVEDLQKRFGRAISSSDYIWFINYMSLRILDVTPDPQNAYEILWVGTPSASESNSLALDEAGVVGPFKTAALSGRSAHEIDSGTVELIEWGISQQLDTLYEHARYLLEHHSVSPADTEHHFQTMREAVESGHQLVSSLRRYVNFFVKKFPAINYSELWAWLNDTFNDVSLKELFDSRWDITGIHIHGDVGQRISYVANTYAPGNVATSTRRLQNRQSDPTELFRVTESYFLKFVRINIALNANDMVTVLNIIGKAPIESVAIPTVQRGLPSVTTPATAILQTIAFQQTLPISEAALKKIQEENPKWAGALYACARILNSAQGIADAVVDSVLKESLGAISKLEALLSYSNAISGGGEFSSSLLKCSGGSKIDINMGVSLDGLAALFAEVADLAKNLLAKLFNVFSMLGGEISCKPLAAIEGLLNDFVTVLPLNCVVAIEGIPDEISLSLQSIKASGSVQQSVIRSFQRNLATVNIEVNMAATKVRQVKQDAGCSSEAIQKFFDSAAISVKLADLSPELNVLNPIADSRPPFSLGSLTLPGLGTLGIPLR